MIAAMAEVKKQDTVLTAQGLTLKNVEKLNRIKCEATQQDVVLRTWQFGRIIRRDFNLLSYKLFFAVRRDEQRSRIRRMLEDIEEEAEVLNTMTRRHELPTPADSTFLNLRIVSDESQRLLDALVAADKALAKLNTSEMMEVADENCGPFNAAYLRLKKLLLEPAKESGSDTASQHN